MSETAPASPASPPPTPARTRRLLFGLRLLQRALPSDRQATLLWAAAVGLGGALAALAFQELTDAVKWLLTAQEASGFVETFRGMPWWRRLLVPAGGALLAGLVLTLAARFRRRGGTDYMEAVALGDGDVPVAPSLMKSGAALLAIASGEAIGREGPLVQLAALVASVTGRFRRFAPARRRLLVACGAAAGIAAAYNAPIAGALFVAEIIIGSIAMENLGPLLIASAVSALTVRTLAGSEPLYQISTFHLGSPSNLLWFAVLGVVAGLAAHGFQLALHAGKQTFGRWPAPIWLRLAVGGLIIGALAVYVPEVTGNGKSVIRTLLADQYSWQFAALLLALKVAAVAVAFGSGAVGGVFTPSLLTGAVTGFLFAWSANAVWPGADLNAIGFSLVGMGSFLAAVTQAPVMAILMLFEMTLEYEIMLPLMTAAVLAYFTARAIGTPTLYGEALQAGPRSVFDRPLGEVTVGDVMRPRPASVTPEAPFRVVAARLLAFPGRELMVATTGGEFAGVILLPDVQPFLRDPLLADTVLAQDIARDDVPTLAPGIALAEALVVFSRSDADALAVVDPADQRLAGSLSRNDVFLTIAELARRAHLT